MKKAEEDTRLTICTCSGVGKFLSFLCIPFHSCDIPQTQNAFESKEDGRTIKQTAKKYDALYMEGIITIEHVSQTDLVFKNQCSTFYSELSL
jgi:hypothetical protein